MSAETSAVTDCWSVWPKVLLPLAKVHIKNKYFTSEARLANRVALWEKKKSVHGCSYSLVRTPWTGRLSSEKGKQGGRTFWNIHYLERTQYDSSVGVLDLAEARAKVPSDVTIVQLRRSRQIYCDCTVEVSSRLCFTAQSQREREHI